MPEIDKTQCIQCGDCVPICPQNALQIVSREPVVDPTRCSYCGECEDVCPVGAIALPYEIILRETQRETQNARTTDRAD